jgi:hypothetical protein
MPHTEPDREISMAFITGTASSVAAYLDMLLKRGYEKADIPKTQLNAVERFFNCALAGFRGNNRTMKDGSPAMNTALCGTIARRVFEILIWTSGFSDEHCAKTISAFLALVSRLKSGEFESADSSTVLCLQEFLWELWRQGSEPRLTTLAVSLAGE